MKLEVGDKVRVLETLDDDDTPSWIGMTGKVVDITDYVVVSFKSGAGWAGTYNNKHYPHCWSIDEKHLEKVEKKKYAAQAYKGNGKHTWEFVGDIFPAVSRLRVPGGWLYQVRTKAPVFVPMPEVVKHKV